MSEKEERVLNEIIKYVNINKIMPSRRILQKKLGFKSVNSITWYIKLLTEKNYLKKNKENKIVLNNLSKNYQDGLKTISIINAKNGYIHLFLEKNDEYIAYKIHHDYFKSQGISKNDVLIIKKNKKLNNNDIGLFIIDSKYRVMRYNYQDGFYILNDNEELLLSKIKIIGKVIMVEKKL